MAEIRQFLEKRKAQGLLRALSPASMRREGKIYFGKKEFVDLSSNDYLGLSGHPRIIEAARKAQDKFGNSSSGSRLLSGDLNLRHELEESVARFKNKESALVFNSGYHANIGVLSSLYGKDDCIFSDRLNHASIVDGVILSRARFFRFRHNDTAHLESLLNEQRGRFRKALIVTESVFSMDGDKAPLKGLVRLKDKYDCSMMIDEAHATGIFGKNGSGLAEEEGLAGKIELIMGTFGKALGSFGAYVASSREIIEYLINTSRSFIYSTALPPAVIASDLASIGLIEQEPFRRLKLLESAANLRGALKEKGFDVKGESQIVPLITGDNLRTVKLAKRLQEKGYWVLPIRPPTVPQGEGRLRFSLSFCHNKDTLERLIDDISGIEV